MSARRPEGRTARLALVAVGVLLAHQSLAAQQIAHGVVSGVVKDETGKPIGDVQITAIRSATMVRTDSAGHFAMTLPAGSIDMSIRRLAFAPIVLMMQVVANDTSEVEVTLTIVAQKLTGVVVLADPAYRRVLQAFEARRKLGFGHFITRAQIAKRQPSLLSDMVRMIPGTTLTAGRNGNVTLRFARTAGRDCPPQFYIDGIQATGFEVDDMPPADVEGVEIYAGAATVPPEYSRIYSTSNCGVVIIWTRLPGA